MGKLPFKNVLSAQNLKNKLIWNFWVLFLRTILNNYKTRRIAKKRPIGHYNVGFCQFCTLIAQIPQEILSVLMRHLVRYQPQTTATLVWTFLNLPHKSDTTFYTPYVRKTEKQVIILYSALHGSAAKYNYWHEIHDDTAFYRTIRTVPRASISYLFQSHISETLYESLDLPTSRTRRAIFYPMFKLNLIKCPSDKSRIDWEGISLRTRTRAGRRIWINTPCFSKNYHKKILIEFNIKKFDNN